MTLATIANEIFTAIEAVIPHADYATFRIDVPGQTYPNYPGAMYTMESKPDDQYTVGANYYTHTAQVFVFVKDADTISGIMQELRASLEAIPDYEYEEESGDADYEGDPDAYGQFLTVRFRTRN